MKLFFFCVLIIKACVIKCDDEEISIFSDETENMFMNIEISVCFKLEQPGGEQTSLDKSYLIKDVKDKCEPKMFCNFKSPDRKNIYSCTASGMITSKADFTYSVIKGSHDENKNDSDVKMFSAENKIMNFIPTNMAKYFNNIEVIVIKNSGLKELTHDDINGFKHLKKLFLENNSLQIIEKETFAGNSHLEKISLKGNKIVMIDSEAFQGVAGLRVLLLQENNCTNAKTDALKNFSVTIPDKCLFHSAKDFDSMIDRYNQKYKEQNEATADLHKQISELKNSTEKCLILQDITEKKNTELTGQAGNLKKQLVTLQLNMDSLKKKSQNCSELLITNMHFLNNDLKNLNDSLLEAQEIIKNYEHNTTKYIIALSVLGYLLLDVSIVLIFILYDLDTAW